MAKVSCNIISDLLPLYYDQVCSNESKNMVEEHLSECEDCKRKLENIQDDMKPPMNVITNNRADRNAIKKIAVSWKKARFKSFIKGGLIGGLLISLIVFGYFGLFHWNISKVSTDAVEINNVSEMDDGKIAYHAKITDGYSLTRLKYSLDNKGNFYITPLRPIIKQESQAQPTSLLENGYDFIDIKEQEMVRDIEIKKIFYGTPKDNILIWEKGMELPKASEEVYKQFGLD